MSENIDDEALLRKEKQIATVKKIFVKSLVVLSIRYLK